MRAVAEVCMIGAPHGAHQWDVVDRVRLSRACPGVPPRLPEAPHRCWNTLASCAEHPKWRVVLSSTRLGVWAVYPPGSEWAFAYRPVWEAARDLAVEYAARGVLPDDVLLVSLRGRS